MSPFPFIEELEGIDKITGFNDLIKIMDWIYSLIPRTSVPYEKPITMQDIEGLYVDFNTFQIGGWCGLNAEFFKWILEGYQRLDPLNLRYRSYNYGIQELKLTHIGVLVEIDRMEFLLDPYFNRYYVHKDGFPLQFKDLLHLVQERKEDKYRSVFQGSKKPDMKEDGTVLYLSPEELLKGVLEIFETNGLSKAMKSIFNETNPDLLMLLKIQDQF